MICIRSVFATDPMNNSNRSIKWSDIVIENIEKTKNEELFIEELDFDGENAITFQQLFESKTIENKRTLKLNSKSDSIKFANVVNKLESDRKRMQIRNRKKHVKNILKYKTREQEKLENPKDEELDRKITHQLKKYRSISEYKKNENILIDEIFKNKPYIRAWNEQSRLVQKTQEEIVSDFNKNLAIIPLKTNQNNDSYPDYINVSKLIEFKTTQN